MAIGSNVKTTPATLTLAKITTWPPSPTDAQVPSAKLVKDSLDSVSAGFVLTDVKSANYSAVSGECVLTDTTAGSFTITLPATPSNGATIRIIDAGKSWATHNLTINRNGEMLNGLAANLVLDATQAELYLIFSSTAGWVLSSADERLAKATTAYEWGNHATAGYLTSFTESDPIFSASAASTIDSTQISHWDATYSWALTFSESDPVFVASAAYSIGGTDITHWNTAYGWGNHSSVGYLVASSLSATAPLAYNSSTQTYSIPVATASQNGYLSSADWTTFNSKLGSVTIASLPSAAKAYPVAISYTGGKPGNTQVFGVVLLPIAVQFASGVSGSSGIVTGTNPAATYTITIAIYNSSKVQQATGSVAISTSGAFTFTWSSSYTSSAGDYIKFTGQATADSSLLDFGFVFLGYIT